MTNSHIAEVLSHAALRFNDAGLRKKAAEFIARSIRMMFFDGDPTRPNSFEHYNPATGSPSLYRGIDDYQHSWIVDLIIKYVCGIRPGPAGLTIDPFPFGLEHVLVDDVIVSGNKYKVEIKRCRFTVWRNGKCCAEGRLGKAVILNEEPSQRK